MQAENNCEEQVGLGTMPPEFGSPEFVPVVFAANREEAERMRDILESSGIPALSDVGGDDGVDGDAVLGSGLPILVPEHLHNRASDVIAELESVTSGSVAPDRTEDVEGCDEEVDGDFDELDDDLDDDFDDEDFDDDDEDLEDDDDDLDDDLERDDLEDLD